MRKFAVKCIPTEYNGIKFRSKTEALFAKWCDLCNLRWLYEPEGFVGKKPYLPDFYLPEIKCVVEIKPPMFMDETEKMKEMITDKQFAGHTFIVATMHNKTLQVILLWEVWDIDSGNPAIHKFEDGSELCLSDRWCSKCFKPIFCGDGSWECRACGEHDGKHHLITSPYEVDYQVNSY